MKIYRSWLGAVLAVVYLIAAALIILDDLQCTGGGWINLCGLTTTLVTLPSQLTLGMLLEWLGVPKINYFDPHLSDAIQIALHVLVCAALIYLIGYLLEKIARKLMAKTSAA